MNVRAPPPETVPEDAHARWKFLRDVMVFQFKLVLGNLHNFLFVPVSLVAAAADLLFKSGRQGSRFYKVMEWAQHGDEAIGLYSALKDNEAAGFKARSVDAVVARIEDVIVREYGKGGTTASVMAAVGRALGRIQRETPARFNPEDIVRRAAEKIRDKIKRGEQA